MTLTSLGCFVSLVRLSVLVLAIGGRCVARRVTMRKTRSSRRTRVGPLWRTRSSPYRPAPGRAVGVAVGRELGGTDVFAPGDVGAV
ncbi:MAG: hypothetical protein M3228_00185 [Actinomycetota bacterium]|nr:hypothetical protein [Actinomycetota bacterium]